jgi:hypothetical protein
MVLGLPFNFFWLLAWIMLTTVCMGIVYRIESRRAAKSRDPGEPQS